MKKTGVTAVLMVNSACNMRSIEQIVLELLR